MPVCHFRPEGNWVNDPLGLTKVGDLYHLFYQYNPVGAEPGLKHWGHAISQDLVAWEILPLALSPTPGGPDEGGCWSGSVTTLVDPPHLFYTAVRHDPRRGRIETVCLALGDAGLREWRKHPDFWPSRRSGHLWVPRPLRLAGWGSVVSPRGFWYPGRRRCRTHLSLGRPAQVALRRRLLLHGRHESRRRDSRDVGMPATLSVAGPLRFAAFNR